MKNSTRLIALAAALAVAYPVAAWFTGTRIEAKMNEWSRQAEPLPSLKLVQHQFKRGLFSSEEDMIIEIPPQLLASVFPLLPQAEPKPLALHIVNHITHGPVPGFRVGSATVDSELLLDDAAKAALAKIFGTQAPLSIRTKLNYLGGGSVLLSSPAFKAKLGKDEDDIEWKGVKLDVGFNSDYQKLRMNLEAPGLVAKGHEGSVLTVDKMQMAADVQQAYPKSFLYLGSSSVTIDHLGMTSNGKPDKPFELQKIAMESNATSKGDLVDMVVKLGAGKLVAGKQEFNDFHYDYAIRRLHGPTLAKLVDAIYHPPKDQDVADAMENALKPWKEFGPVLLQYKPEYSIDRISVSTPQGDAKIAAKATLDDTAGANVQSIAQLLATLQGTAEVKVAEPMLANLLASSADPQNQAMMQDLMKKQIAMFEQRGYATRDGTSLSANFEWKNGQMRINGKPFPAPMR